jgi:hypothetical protein
LANRRNSLALGFGLVHAGRVEIADLAGHSVALGRILRGLFEETVEEAEIVLIELAIDRPGGLVGRDGIVFLPAAAGVLVEIHAGIGELVHRFETEAGRVRQRWFSRGRRFVAGGVLRQSRSGQSQAEQQHAVCDSHDYPAILVGN